ncbi:MAG: HXXEE domain-containing protein [Burkholderiales bacterium]
MTALTLFAPFVVGVLVHNAEEALWLPRWSTSAGRWHRGVGAAEFRFGAVVLSAALVVVALLAAHFGPRSIAATVFFGAVFAMVANALVPHLVVSLATRRYMPGTATGLLLNLPLGGLLLHRGVAEQWIDVATIVWAGPLVALGLVASIPLLFALGRRCSGTQRRDRDS